MYPLLAVVLALAGDSLTGRVVDRAGNPVAASIQVVELHRTVAASTDGGFSLPDVPIGRYTLVVRHLGYAPAVRAIDVTVAGLARLDIVLEPAPFEVEPITVTATRAPLANLGSPLPVASLGPDALRREQSVSLAHALADLPGVRVLGTGEQIGKPVVRGLTGSRVLVLEDGSRLEDYSWSDEDGPSVDARFAERIEVIRGPASVLYGSDAVGGVVNVIPADLPDAAGGAGFMRGRVEAYGASSNIELGSALTLEGASSRLGWRVLGIGRFAGSLHTPAGELDNTGFGAFNGEGAIGLRGARGDAQLRLSHYGGEFKLLEANAPPGPQPGGPVRKMEDDRLQLTATRLAGALRLEVKAQWQRHNLIEVSDEAPGGGGGPGTESKAFDLLLSTGSVDLLAHHGGGRVRGTVGVSGIGQWNDSRGPIPIIPDARVRGAAMFLFEELRLGRWSFLAGARGDARRVTGDADTSLARTAQRRSWSAFAGDAGVVYRPVERLALAANAGRAWRSPTLFELFSNGPHLGEARWEVGDPGLKPELGTDLDVSVRWAGALIQAEVAAYRNAVSRYVYIQRTPQDTVFNSDTLHIYDYRQADALLTGVEASVTAQVTRGLVVRGRFDQVRGTNRTTDLPLPLVPPARGALGVELHGGMRRVGMEIEAVARQTRLDSLDIPTAGYALVHLDAGLVTTAVGRSWTIDFAVRNVANRRYRDFLSRYKEFALNPGRNITLRVATTW